MFDCKACGRIWKLLKKKIDIKFTVAFTAYKYLLIYLNNAQCFKNVEIHINQVLYKEFIYKVSKKLRIKHWNIQ